METILDPKVIKDELKVHLIRMLDSITGRKVLVLDPNLSGALSLVTEFSFLKERGIEKVYFLKNEPFTTEAGSILYLTKPGVEELTIIANQIIEFISKNINKEYNLYLVPQRTLLAERLLEEKGVLGSISQISFFPMDFIPLEQDLFSLEFSSTFKELYLEGDFSCLSTIATSLMKLQDNNGYFKRILGKGNYSKALKDMLQRLRLEKEVEGATENMLPSKIMDSLIIIERSSDLITPLLTQLTYEGLLEEYYGIRNTLIEVPYSLIESQKSNTSEASHAKKKKVALNSSDKIFKNLRDLNFAEVGGVLNKEAKRLDGDYQKRHEAQSVKEIRDFVSKLGNLQSEHSSLRLHTSLAEVLMSKTSSEEFDIQLENEQNLISAGVNNTASLLNNPLELVEDLVAQQAPLLKILRLISLQTQVCSGLNSKVYNKYKKDICQVYGYHHILTFDNLQKVGLIYENQSGKSNIQRYSSIAKAFRLLVDEVDERQPNDISYVYSGYAPLTIRMAYTGINIHDKFGSVRLNPTSAFNSLNGLVTSFSSNNNNSKTQTLGSGWAKFEDVLNFVPGKTFDAVQKFDRANVKNQSDLAIPTNQHKIIIILFLGGCTYTEIAALRYLSKADEANCKFLILTTHITSGSSLLEPLIESGNPLLAN